MSVYQRINSFIYSMPGIIIGLVCGVAMLAEGIICMIIFIKRNDRFLTVVSFFVLLFGITGIAVEINRARRLKRKQASLSQ